MLRRVGAIRIGVLVTAVLSLGFAAVSFAASGGTGGADACAGDGGKCIGSVVIFGSSSINDFFGRMIEDDVVGLGMRAVRRGLPSAGLARPDFRDVMRELESLPLDSETRAVVIYFGGNDAQALWLRPSERSRASDVWIKWSDARWHAIYERRVAELVEAVCSRGVPQAIVLPPADVAIDGLQRRLDRVRQLQRSAVSGSRCGSFVPTSNNGEGGWSGPDGDALHTPDGIHMTRDGAALIWDRIRSQVLGLVR